MIMGVDVISLFKDSITMWLLLAASIAGVGFIIDRIVFFTYWKLEKPKAEIWFNKMLEKIADGEKEQVSAECKKANNALAQMLGSALANMELQQEDLSKILNNKIISMQSKIEQNIGFLGTISSISPLLGLLGTVAGIIRSFRDIAVSGSGGSSVVAMGVAIALVTTAIGILIAVPALVAYNYFVSASADETAWMENLRDNLLIAIKKSKGKK